MKETHITIYIHDLEISDKSKSFLARVGLMKLDDLLNCNMTELSAMRNISEDVLQELNGVITHSDVIISFFEERAKRIKEILPNVQDAPIESLGLGTRATNALRRGGIHTVGALIQMSQKDIFELRNVGVLSREKSRKPLKASYRVVRSYITSAKRNQRQLSKLHRKAADYLNSCRKSNLLVLMMFLLALEPEMH